MGTTEPCCRYLGHRVRDSYGSGSSCPDRLGARRPTCGKCGGFRDPKPLGWLTQGSRVVHQDSSDILNLTHRHDVNDDMAQQLIRAILQRSPFSPGLRIPWGFSMKLNTLPPPPHTHTRSNVAQSLPLVAHVSVLTLSPVADFAGCCAQPGDSSRCSEDALPPQAAGVCLGYRPRVPVGWLSATQMAPWNLTSAVVETVVRLPGCSCVGNPDRWGPWPAW